MRGRVVTAGWWLVTRVGDAVVEDDDRSRGEILCYEPPDVPDRRMHRIVRVRRAKRALVAAESPRVRIGTQKARFPLCAPLEARGK